MALPSKDDWPELIVAVKSIGEGLNGIADAVDRLTFVVEEVASRGLEIPIRDEER